MEYKTEQYKAQEWRWSYAIARTEGPLDMRITIGPMPAEEITALLGGPYEVAGLRDGTAIAVRLDRDSAPLPPNPHYQGLRGDVVVGKLDPDGLFVGLLGVSF